MTIGKPIAGAISIGTGITSADVESSDGGGGYVVVCGGADPSKFHFLWGLFWNCCR